MRGMRTLGVVTVAMCAAVACGGDDEEEAVDDTAASPAVTTASNGGATTDTTGATDAADDTGTSVGDTEVVTTEPVDEADGGGGGATIESCDLLSDEEVAEALGDAIVDRGPTGGLGESLCTWATVGYLNVTVSVGSPGTAPGNTFEPMVMLDEPVPVEGLPGAYYVGLGTVDFPADERYNSVQVVGPTDNRAVAERLAAVLTERIEAAG